MVRKIPRLIIQIILLCIDGTGTLDIANAAGSVKADVLHNAILVTQAMLSANVESTENWIKSL